MSYDLTVRCPICLTSKQISKNTPTGRAIDCRSCERAYSLVTALPGERQEQAVPSPSTGYTRRSARKGVSQWVYFFGLLYSVLGILVTLDSGGWSGPSYLLAYGAFTLVGQKVVWYIYDNNESRRLGGVPNFWFAVTLLVMSALRYVVASVEGMGDFLFLGLMLLFGVVLCFLRIDNFMERSSANIGNNCSSCSGCGSSCGGGCGGCG